MMMIDEQRMTIYIKCTLLGFPVSQAFVTSHRLQCHIYNLSPTLSHVCHARQAQRVLTADVFLAAKRRIDWKAYRKIAKLAPSASIAYLHERRCVRACVIWYGCSPASSSKDASWQPPLMVRTGKI